MLEFKMTCMLVGLIYAEMRVCQIANGAGYDKENFIHKLNYILIEAISLLHFMCIVLMGDIFSS